MLGHDIGSAAVLQAKLRPASKHNGPWPTISIWHGTNDNTVAYSNADAIRGHWGAVLAVDASPVETRLAGGHGHRKQVWKDAAGGDAIELFTLAGMAHGTPLDVSVGTEHARSFMLDVGLSSTRIAAQTWGLTPSFERRLDAVGEDAGRSKKQPPLPPSSSGIQKIIEDALKAAGLMR